MPQYYELEQQRQENNKNNNNYNDNNINYNKDDNAKTIRDLQAVILILV
jgi:hypothetical protein